MDASRFAHPLSVRTCSLAQATLTLARRLVSTSIYATHISFMLVAHDGDVSGRNQNTRGSDRSARPPPTMLGSKYGNLIGGTQDGSTLDC